MLMGIKFKNNQKNGMLINLIKLSTAFLWIKCITFEFSLHKIYAVSRQKNYGLFFNVKTL